MLIGQVDGAFFGSLYWRGSGARQSLRDRACTILIPTFQRAGVIRASRENMKTRIRTASAAIALIVIGLGAVTAGCGKYSFRNLKAMKAFKEANDHYRGQRWREAVDRYEAAIASNPDFETNPDLLAAYFFLGNSYDNLYKPARQGEPENDALMKKAIENYTKAAEQARDPLIKRRALEYLVAAYAPDKLNNPAEAEPIVQKMIALDPNEPTAYFQLSK